MVQTKLRIPYAVILMLLLASGAWGQQNERSLQDRVAAKNYYFFALVASDNSIRSSLADDADFRAAMNRRRARFQQSPDCQDLECFIGAFQWTAGEIDTIARTLKQTFRKNQTLKRFAEQQLLPSKAYGLPGTATPEAYMEKAWRQDAWAMNYAISVYGAGEAPNYPKIDSISFDITNRRYLALLRDIAHDVLQATAPDECTMMQPLYSALRLLEVNERWDAGIHEALQIRENEKAYAAITQTDFSAYPYSLVLTLGAGPEVYDQPISPGGMLRARQAAHCYFSKLAPFIVVSGGRVHPYKTPYCEAVEMKKYLMDVCQVPEEAIIIEPHARHTTTNLRNTARIMLRQGFPADKWALINSAEEHIDAVCNMEVRCMRELGYVPYILGKRPGARMVTFKPREESLQIDPDEPLDP